MISAFWWLASTPERTFRVSSGDFLRLSGEEPPLLVAEKVIERDTPLLRHQYPLPYLRVDDELLLTVAEVERLLENSLTMNHSNQSNGSTLVEARRTTLWN